MDTILLYHRCFFTYHHMYILESLSKKFNIVHVAYSDKEYQQLKQFDPNVEVIIFTDEIKKIYKQQHKDQDLLKRIDQLFYSQTKRRFTLNASLQGDRSYYLLSYDEALLMAQANYLFWSNVLIKNKVKYVFHEAVSSFSLHVCSVLCKEMNIRYLFQMNGCLPNYETYHYYSENDVHTCFMMEEKYQYYIKHPELVDIDCCKKVLSDSQNNFDIAAAAYIKKTVPLFILKLKALKENVREFLLKNPYDRVTNSLDYMGLVKRENRQIYINVKNYKKYIKFEQIHSGDKYYYYSLHLEPEATITYLSDQLFSNQINLIKNIAAQLPVGVYLYVKDHPHAFGYRNYYDYLQLQNVPNIKLLERSIPGKLVISGSLGVFTINGTAGFEAVMLKKPVYCFARTYYSFYSGVRYIDNVKDIKHILYEDDIKIDQSDLYAYVNAYLDSLYLGKLWFFRDPKCYPELDLHKESELFVDSFIDYISRIP